MHGLRILTLLVTLLLFTAKLKTAAAQYEHAGQYTHGWPYNLPADAKFWPEDGPFRRRDLEGFNSETGRVPVGVRKMSGDEREKFYTDYWIFDGPRTVGGERPIPQPLESGRVLRPRDDEDDEALQLYNNASTPHPFKAPILLHTNDHSQTPLNQRSPRAALLALQNRDFKCPGGTTDCSSIGRPNSCCANGEVCQIIPNTGLGDVGCCPVGKGCSGDLKNCDLGFTKCSDDLGGGCCIPEYVCVGVGCGPGPNLISLIVVTPQRTVSQLPSTTSPPSSTSASLNTTAACPTAFKSCPASLSGGCCRTDRVCGATDCPASPGSSLPTSSSSVAAPVRPTTDAEYNSAITAAGCPVGYYECNAYYHGNCCRAGRDCGFTDCPAIGGSTVVNTNGITIVAGISYASNTAPGVATAVATTSPNDHPGSCASGWYSCAAKLSGGCCPSGFGCSVANCVASVGAIRTVGKIAPSSAVELKPSVGWMIGVMVLSVAGLMVWL